MNYRLSQLTIKQPKRSNRKRSVIHKTTIVEPLKISDITSEQKDNLLTYSFLYENGDKSPEMQIEIPAPLMGEKGDKGDDGLKGTDGKTVNGKQGKDGKSAPQIAKIDAYARQWIITLDDGTKLQVPVRFPEDKKDQPGLSFGGQKPPVQNIVAGDNITVTSKNGIFTISAPLESREIDEGGNALPTDSVLACTGTFTVDLFESRDAIQVLSIKSISGTITVDGFEDELIDGSATAILTTGQAITIAPITGGWIII